jgi:uncharacterized membrane protein
MFEKDFFMKLYHKISPVLMFLGFALLAIGVFLAMSYYNQRFVYTFVVAGLILQIFGRIGVHFIPKKTEEKEDEEFETNIETNIDSTE